jgi:hypothetical protein
MSYNNEDNVPPRPTTPSLSDLLTPAQTARLTGHRLSADSSIFWRDLRSSGKFRDDMKKRSRANGRRVQTVKGLRVQLDEDALPFDPADDFLD